MALSRIELQYSLQGQFKEIRVSGAPDKLIYTLVLSNGVELPFSKEQIEDVLKSIREVISSVAPLTTFNKLPQDDVTRALLSNSLNIGINGIATPTRTRIDEDADAVGRALHEDNDSVFNVTDCTTWYAYEDSRLLPDVVQGKTLCSNCEDFAFSCEAGCNGCFGFTMEEVKYLVKTGAKIQAIKAIRNRFGANRYLLRDYKEHVEAVMDLFVRLGWMTTEIVNGYSCQRKHPENPYTPEQFPGNL